MRSFMAALVLTLASASLATPAAIRGVDPRVYLKARKPVPAAIADLKAAPVELSRRIISDGPDGFLVGDDAYPAALAAEPRSALRALERRALVIGALHALALRKPVDAHDLIASQLAARDPLVRADAADQLGQLGQLGQLDNVDSIVTLLARVAREDQDVRVREAACVGLAKARSQASLLALASFVLDDSDELRQRAAIRALAVLGSRWAWQARGDVAGGAAIRQEARALLAKVEVVSKSETAQAVAAVERQLR